VDRDLSTGTGRAVRAHSLRGAPVRSRPRIRSSDVRRDPPPTSLEPPVATVTVVRTVAASPEEAFDVVADFTSAAAWDPGVASARRLDEGPLQVGSRFALRYRVAGPVTVPLTYEITHLERPGRVVLRSVGLAHEGEDDVRFEEGATGTEVTWRASFRLRGPGRLLEPGLRRGFPGVAAEAGDGLQRHLDALAGEDPSGQTT
jgi:hypothetical protein